MNHIIITYLMITYLMITYLIMTYLIITYLIMMGGRLPSSSIWPSRQEICMVFTVLPYNITKQVSLMVRVTPGGFEVT